ncbi:hypothetical protein VQ643_07055 [Pseudomonas sp. F1_0610]|uniref:hypothetical protein n=1 Tax=Pseudomonas sp. F1_0610 TaxID=3114284 RepID=UPI0039C4430D
MNKTQYLANPEVAKFVDWLAENHDKLEISLCIKSSKFVPSGLTKVLVGLEQLLENYKWVSSWALNGEQVKSSDWLTTQASLEQLGNKLKVAIDTKKDYSLIIY